MKRIKHYIKLLSQRKYWTLSNFKGVIQAYFRKAKYEYMGFEVPKHIWEQYKWRELKAKDCLDNETSEIYKKKIQEMSVKRLIDDGYIRLSSKLNLYENEEIKSYIFITFDHFSPNANNPEFRDCIVNIDVLSHTDYWDIGDYR